MNPQRILPGVKLTCMKTQNTSIFPEVPSSLPIPFPVKLAAPQRQSLSLFFKS